MKEPSQAAQDSKVVRISTRNYKNFNEAKRIYAARLKRPKVTYNQFLSELLRVADMLLRGKEVYLVEGKLFTDLAEARGRSVTLAAQSNQRPKSPEVLVKLGKDDGLKGWAEES